NLKGSLLRYFEGYVGPCSRLHFDHRRSGFITFTRVILEAGGVFFRSFTIEQMIGSRCDICYTKSPVRSNFGRSFTDWESRFSRNLKEQHFSIWSILARASRDSPTNLPYRFIGQLLLNGDRFRFSPQIGQVHSALFHGSSSAADTGGQLAGALPVCV